MNRSVQTGTPRERRSAGKLGGDAIGGAGEDAKDRGDEAAKDRGDEAADDGKTHGILGLTRFDGQLLYVVGTFVSILLWVAN